MISDQTLAYAEELTSAILGVDELYRRESGDEDGLVVLNMSDEHQPEHMSSYKAASERFTELKVLSENLPEPDRKLYYGQFCDSTLSFMAWREGRLEFQEQISKFLHVPACPASDTELETLRVQMDTLLTRMGYTGSLVEKCTAWEMKNRLPADQVVSVFNDLMDEAWNRTNERLPIPAPKSDSMKVKPVQGVAFNARCNYLKRTVELNIDPILTLPGLKHLVTHEGCPGHYVQFKLRETWYREGTAPADVLLSIVNTASSTTFEGIADNGLILLDWVNNEDDQLQSIMSRYRAGIGTAAAWMIHALHKPIEQVTEWLRSVSLAGGEGWVNNRIRFLSAPQRSVLIWSYWQGETSVTPNYLRALASKRPDFLRFLYGRMHSPQSVVLYFNQNITD
jgi:hypothetical protein